jgi:hypothetical protein
LPAPGRAPPDLERSRAADISQLEPILSGLMGVTAAGPYVKNLDRALRSMNRQKRYVPI